MKNRLRITTAQINLTVGDIKGNAKKIVDSVNYARDQQKADVIVFPELTLTSYPPEDLLLRDELYQETQKVLKQLILKIKNIHVILGLPTKEENYHFNSAIVFYNGKILAKYNKQFLPNMGVFDEKRYFSEGKKTCIVNIKGINTAILICHDIWHQEPLCNAKKQGAKLAITLNASPFEINKHQLRKKILTNRTKENKIPIIYVNHIGFQDELIFDGGSLVINADGKIAQQSQFLVEQLMSIDITINNQKILISTKKPPTLENNIQLIYKALVLGIKDYVEKNNCDGVVLGVSGGIDSSLTLAIAIDALGKNKVKTFYLPSRHSSKLSSTVVNEQAKLTKTKLSIISIEQPLQAFLETLSKQKLKNLTVQNIQARCRGTILMAFANQNNSIALATSNKSELAVGYCTLYGDMAGGFASLKDIPKTLVYKLARYRNGISYVIPKKAITRAPSAELAHDQKDSDDLPDYPTLDKILKKYIEYNQSPQEIIAEGFDKNIVINIVKRVDRNEHKRRQAPPGIKITNCAFGKERRYPITSKFR